MAKRFWKVRGLLAEGKASEAWMAPNCNATSRHTPAGFRVTVSDRRTRGIGEAPTFAGAIEAAIDDFTHAEGEGNG